MGTTHRRSVLARRWHPRGPVRTALVLACIALVPLVEHSRLPGAQAADELVLFDRTVGAGADDAEESSSGAVSLASGDLELTTDGTKVQTVGLRFTNVTVPAGATITRAWVQFRVDQASPDPASLRVFGERNTNPGTFTTTIRNLSTRTRTDAFTDWVPPPWPTVGAAGADQRTPELAGIIQEIIGLTGWTTGNPLTFIITGTGRRTAEAFEGTGPPTLHLEYTNNTPPPPPTNQPPTVAAGLDQSVVVSATTSLSGVVSDDGLPSSGTLSSLWSLQSGPGSVVFANPNAAATTATFSAAGTYVLLLSASDSQLSASDALTVTVNPQGSVPIVIDRTVGAGADDAEESLSGALSLASGDLELTTDGTKVQTVGLRFTNVTVPAGATITRAWVQFRVDQASPDPASLRVFGERNTNPGTFTTTIRNLSTRTRTDAFTDWVPPPWPTVGAAGADQRTPELAGIIQEIIGLTGWTTGNPLTFIITGTGRRTAEAFEGTGPPTLHLEYTNNTPPPPPTNQPPTVAAGLDQSVVVSATTSLSGVVSDDGLPSSGTLSSLWSLQSGPGSVVFANPNAAATTATFSAAGTYVLLLSASDSQLSASDALTVTVNPQGSVPIVIDRTVGAGADDAEESSSGALSLASGDLELTTDGTKVQTVGLRFTNVTVPAGATITRAWVQFRVDQASPDPASLRVFGERNTNPGTFTTTIRNLSTRTRTDAFTDWVPPPWPTVGAAGADQRTPELAGIIQEIIGLTGWTTGNPLTFIITGTGRRTAEAFEGTGPPTLHLEYTNNTPPPPPTEWPTRAEALARPNVVTAAGTWTSSYEVDRPPALTTYDLRSFTSTAYPFATLYAVRFGGTNPAVDLVTVGGVVLGQIDRNLTYEEVYANYAGDALRVSSADRAATYDLRVDNVVDGYNPRVAEGTEQDNTVRFLLDGAYMTYIRDNAVENDNLMSGTIRDCLFDGVFTLLSAKGSATSTYTNTAMVVTLERVIARLQAMPRASAADGFAHNKVFKWDYDAAGSVVVRDSIFYLEELPDGISDNLPFPQGVYQNVTVVLGAGFDGDGDGDVTDLDYPGGFPAGVTQSRDLSIFTAAHDAWLTAHGYN